MQYFRNQMRRVRRIRQLLAGERSTHMQYLKRVDQYMISVTAETIGTNRHNHQSKKQIRKSFLYQLAGAISYRFCVPNFFVFIMHVCSLPEQFIISIYVCVCAYLLCIMNMWTLHVQEHNLRGYPTFRISYGTMLRKSWLKQGRRHRGLSSEREVLGLSAPEQHSGPALSL